MGTFSWIRPDVCLTFGSRAGSCRPGLMSSGSRGGPRGSASHAKRRLGDAARRPLPKRPRRGASPAGFVGSSDCCGFRAHCSYNSVLLTLFVLSGFAPHRHDRMARMMPEMFALIGRRCASALPRLMPPLKPCGILKSLSSESWIWIKNMIRFLSRVRGLIGNGDTFAGVDVGDEGIQAAIDLEVLLFKDARSGVADGDGGAAAEVHRVKGGGALELESDGHGESSRCLVRILLLHCTVFVRDVVRAVYTLK